MDMIETLERKITDGEEFNEMDVAFIKENIDMILSRDNYLEYLFPINDLDFLKSLVLEKRVANQDFIASLCYELQDDSFFEHIINENIFVNPTYIALYLEDRKHIGRYAIDCINNWDGNQEHQNEIENMILRLSKCNDIELRDCLDAILIYSQKNENIDVYRTTILINGIFNTALIDNSINSSETNNLGINISDADIDLYESYIAYFMNHYTVDELYAYETLRNLVNFPYFKEQSEDIRPLMKEVVYYFTNKVDLSQTDNQLLLSQTIQNFWNEMDVDIKARLETMDELVNTTSFLNSEVYCQLLNACHSKLQFSKNNDLGEDREHFQNIITTLLVNNEQLDSPSMVEIIKLLRTDSIEDCMRDNHEGKISEYASKVLAILSQVELAKRIDFSDQIELVSSTSNVVVVKQYLELMDRINNIMKSRNSEYDFYQMHNGSIAMAVINTYDNEFILEQYKKGVIDFEKFMPTIIKAQNLSQEEIISKLEDTNAKLSELDRVALIRMIQDGELMKKYIEVSDFSPKSMARLILSTKDESYIESYINEHEDIDIHLKHLLASSLSDKTIMNEMNAQMIRVSNLSEINLNELMNNNQCKYIQIADSDRDVNSAYLGMEEIYTKEQMIKIIEKAEELLKDIPYSNGGDLIEDTIILKKIYEKYANSSEYDKDAIKDEMEDDWRRQVKCRNFEGGILEGLAVCSGDAFCLKNLLAMRGIKAYATLGDNKDISKDGHAWNTIRLGENYYKFDGTAERTNTRENGILDLRGIRKEHGQTDEYSDTFRIKQSTQAVLDEEKQKVGRKKIDQEWD